MQDSELEALLNRYRPADPPPSLARSIESPDLHTSQSRDPRTWPWALAAAALLGITVGLHVLSTAPFGGSSSNAVLDSQRVDAVAAELGGPEARPFAEYLVGQEQRADADAGQVRVSELPREGMAR